MTFSKPVKIIVFILLICLVGIAYALLKETETPSFVRVALIFILLIGYKIIFLTNNNEEGFLEGTTQQVHNEKDGSKNSSSPMGNKIKSHKVKYISNTIDYSYEYTMGGLIVLMALCMTYAILDLF